MNSQYRVRAWIVLASGRRVLVDGNGIEIHDGRLHVTDAPVNLQTSVLVIASGAWIMYEVEAITNDGGATWEAVNVMVDEDEAADPDADMPDAYEDDDWDEEDEGA